jgi:hypothetical protein
VLIGDSHAVMFGHVIAALANERNLTTSIWALNGGQLPLQVPPVHEEAGTFVTPEEQFQYDTSRLNLLRKWRPKVVFLGSRWAEDDHDPDKLSPLLKFLDEVAAHVIFIESPPELDEIGNRNIAQYIAYRGQQPQSDGLILWPRQTKYSWIHDRGNEKVAKLAAANPKARLVEVADIFRRGENVVVARGKTVYYLDDDHLVAAGAELTRPRFAAIFDELFDAKPVVSTND